METLRKIRVSIHLFPLVARALIRVSTEVFTGRARIITGFRSFSWLLQNLNSNSVRDLKLILMLRNETFCESLFQFGHFQSQIGQDLFVTSVLNGKKDGFFVEFGATNGLNLSNTHILEKLFGWHGILAEPAHVWHEELERNRTASVSHKCVWYKSNEVVEFNETESPELSTIQSYSGSDSHAGNRTTGTSYLVETISLNDLLASFQAPKRIDYLSIDTEGSEYEILASLDFTRYSFDIITCEHNGTAQRARIFDLLTSKGYVRVLTEFSQFDDWYVNIEVLKNQEIQFN